MSLPGNMHNMPRSHRTTYEEVEIIGTGAYGTVYKARDMQNNRYVALKKIRIPSNTQEHGMPMSAMREVATLKQIDSFNHPNIVKLLDVCPGNRKSSELQLYLVFEHVQQDLSKYIEKYQSPLLPTPRIKRIMYEIMSGIYFLHTNRIVHRDIKPQNILVTSEGQIKLADYGLSRVYSFQMTLTSGVVTLWYRAPEVLLQDTYCSAVDIWSCGCILAELYLKRAIFPGNSEIVQLCKIFDIMGLPLEDEWPNTISLPHSSFHPSKKINLLEHIPNMDDQAANLLERMLIFDQRQRITAFTSLEHPYFADEHKHPVSLMKQPAKLPYPEQLLASTLDPLLLHQPAHQYRQQQFKRNGSPSTTLEVAKRRRESDTDDSSSDSGGDESLLSQLSSSSTDSDYCQVLTDFSDDSLMDTSCSSVGGTTEDAGDTGEEETGSEDGKVGVGFRYSDGDRSVDAMFESVYKLPSNSFTDNGHHHYLDSNDNVVKTI